MSAFGTKRTCRVALHMSAIGGKADIDRPLLTGDSKLICRQKLLQNLPRRPGSQNTNAHSLDCRAARRAPFDQSGRACGGIRTWHQALRRSHLAALPFRQCADSRVRSARPSVRLYAGSSFTLLLSVQRGKPGMRPETGTYPPRIGPL